MTAQDIFHETYTALSANRVRSGLTILGIVIGICSVIALVSIGQGASSSISSSIESLGSNLLLVMPGAARTIGAAGVSAGRGSAQSLTYSDASAIGAQVANVAAVSPEVDGRYQAIAGGNNTNVAVDGVTAEYAQIRNVTVSEGSFITDAQNQSLAKVAVLGPTAETDLYPDGSDAVGQTITIKGVPFLVVGITVSKGGSGFNNADDLIYIPAETASHYLQGDEYLSSIDVSATDPTVMTQVQNDMTTLLLQLHHISDPTQADFNIINQADILASASSITSTLTYLLGAIAGISLLVGGIGIMNMMLTSVTERTREIGLRKAIGATRADINMQFIAEAVALTVIGGMIGIILGILISMGVSATGLVTTSISWQAIALAFGVSAAIGVAFGYYPARRAAMLNPIEALRYE
ncbi:MAG: ABC transporter permease [Patescibacteria group bacterium]|nr:ABC transporter permease [Patescibacteria group bacterium]